ncbi:MAG: hypothetical protein JWM77_485, partial [Rhodospirillales bacterium]|nr:hypothetical protein [Rhodospirillales bacterium]
MGNNRSYQAGARGARQSIAAGALPSIPVRPPRTCNHALRRAEDMPGATGSDMNHGVWPMKTFGKSAVVAVTMLSATLVAAGASAQTAKPAAARNVVLVHGAWA